MRNTIVFATALGLGLASLTGCSRQEQQEADRNLSDAVQVINRATQGFVPPDAAGDGTVSLATFRYETLQEARDELEAVSSSDGATADQKAVALRLLSELHASASQQAKKQGMLEFASLAARSTTLLTHLSAVDQAASRARLFSVDQSEALASVQQEIAAQRKQQQTLQQQLGQLKQTLTQLQTEKAAEQKKADAAMAEASRLEGQAFVAQGEQRYDLADNADQKRREAAEYNVEAGKLQAQIDVTQAAIEVMQTQLKLVTVVISDLEKQVKNEQQQQEENRQKVAAIQRERAEAAAALVEEFTQIDGVFLQSVDQPLDTADAEAREAVALVERAQRHARGSAVQADLLAQQLGLVHTLTEHVMALGGYGQIVQVLAKRAPAVMPEQAERFSKVYEQIVSKQQQLIDEAKQVAQKIGEQVQQAAQSGGQDSPAAQAAQRQGQHLQNYLQMLKENDLQ